MLYFTMQLDFFSYCLQGRCILLFRKFDDELTLDGSPNCSRSQDVREQKYFSLSKSKNVVLNTHIYLFYSQSLCTVSIWYIKGAVTF